MTPRPVAPLICPLCGDPLAGHGERHSDFAALRCPSGHSFDVAREGYVNLAAGRPPKHPGDTREQVQARRSFLSSGGYRPLVEAFASAVETGHPAPAVVLDAGSGEGTYTARLAALPGPPAVIGMDVSKEAARLAARDFPLPRFVVTDITEPWPIQTQAVDVVTSVFAPRNAAECARVLGPGGLLVVAIPTPNHLRRMCERFNLLGMEEGKEESVTAKMEAAGLRHVRTTPVDFPLSLDTEALVQLVTMIPSYHHLSGQQQTDIGQTGAFSDQASVRILIFRPKP